MNNINPYELLGVTIDSSQKEVRKSYYALSLMCHPDKGGLKEDMNIIHNAYLYVRKQIEFSDRKEKLEEIEDNFKNFFEKNKIDVPSFYKIWERSEEAEFLREFNKEFNKKNKSNINYKNVSRIFDNGYGKLMEEYEEKSLRGVSNTLLKNTNKKILEKYRNINMKTELKNKFSEEIIVYEEPTAVPENYGEYVRFDVDELKDFSQQTDKLNMFDYKVAHSKKNDRELNEIEKEKINMNTMDALEKLRQGREVFDSYIRKTNKKVVLELKEKKKSVPQVNNVMGYEEIYENLID
jgi:curved DNA-binding protein CbpA